ncbi:Cell division control protein 4 [Ophiocordyceps camponoti-floridani]|uniref:Cell division control protein 4 n=1 Tax=Ophiocordyceps camponoti-floridani TaxID=2030778 RepID=A0A8H4VGZ2_9HYPO|nr:Cell division control protein 4 [Ophiocordyceps camponoti-floridani]
MTSSPTPARRARTPRRPRSAQTVSANTPEAASHRFQLQVSECVETRTVTTTTCLTRKFPRVFVDDPPPLQSLDSKEYPLASKPTPRELLDFTYIMSDDAQDDEADLGYDEPSKPWEACRITNRTAKVTMTPVARKPEPGVGQSPRVQSRRMRQTRYGAADTSTASTPAAVSQPAGSAGLTRPSRGPSRPSVALGKSRRSIQGGGAAVRPEDGGRHPARGSDATSTLLGTPDASQLVTSSFQSPRRRSSVHLDSLQNSPINSILGSSQPPLCSVAAAASPSGSDAFTVFSSNVATPPITDADAAPFGDADLDEALQQSVRGLQHRSSAEVVATQDASLPSPRLSPTLAASQPASTDQDDDETQDGLSQSLMDANSSWTVDSQVAHDGDHLRDGDMLRKLQDAHMVKQFGAARAPPTPVMLDTQSMLKAFDAMKTEMKTFMMYQFLRRCPRTTLRVIADTVNPALKCDFLLQLPPELAYNVLSHLDCRDLCRAAQVSKHWRNMVDRNETGWKELFDRDGFVLPPGELAKAVLQGWGWQDPAGAADYERDLSMQCRLTSSEFELTRNLRQSVTLPRLRSSKRKRGLSAYSASERSKRRAAAAQQPATSREQTGEPRQHKSEGPMSAASAAAVAVPDPKLGLPSLRQLHLYKSLYRRHFMIRRNWTSNDVKPSHVAFAAHPRHVITCLQFDNDKIITGSDDTLIHIYDTKTGKLRKRLEGHEGGVWALQYEGNILVSGSTDRSVRVWDMERGLCQQVFYGHTSTVRCLQILMPTETGRDAADRPVMRPERPLIITGSRDSQLRVWRLPEIGSRRYIQTHPPAQESDCPYFIRALTGHAHSVRAISAHGDTLVSGSYDCTVRVWRISTGDSLHILRGHTQKVYSVVLDHERNRCISGSMDSLVKIWDLVTGTCLHTLEGHSLLVGLLDLRDERLVSAAADSTLRIWEPDTGRCRHTLMAHTGAITCFQHDGHKVISGSEKTVKMWDVHTGQCVRDLLTDLSGVWQVKFDGRRCVAAVQRDQLTYVEILDFGAIRDGQPPEDLGKRILLDGDGVEVADDSTA